MFFLHVYPKRPRVGSVVFDHDIFNCTPNANAEQEKTTWQTLFFSRNTVLYRSTLVSNSRAFVGKLLFTSIEVTVLFTDGEVANLGTFVGKNKLYIQKKIGKATLLNPMMPPKPSTNKKKLAT